ncbi:MAG: PQQ-like beta-propeller repeat protein, partial [Planctomycetales bacterium]|nr:PQQ-like beta-propeller repeat protein [Planctomycetales bacterium]
MFGGDLANTGRVPHPLGAAAPKALWEFKTGGPVASGPTVGPDGTIYVASHDKHLYALSSDGVLKWKFASDDRIWSTPAVAE